MYKDKSLHHIRVYTKGLNKTINFLKPIVLKSIDFYPNFPLHDLQILSTRTPFVVTLNTCLCNWHM